MENRQFNTGVCEETHSKRVIVSALTGVKDFLGLPVFTVRNGSVERQAFDGAITVGGCLCLTGAVVEGVSLIRACALPVSGFSSETFSGFLLLLRPFLESAIVLRNQTGFLPRLFMNGIYFEAGSGAFTYLPKNLAEFLSAHLSDEERKTVFFVAGYRESQGSPQGSAPVLPGERFPGENAFAESCARFIYLFFNGGGEGLGSPVYFLADRLPGFPSPLADLVWDAMHGRPVGLESLLQNLELPPSESASVSRGKPFGKVPLRKRKGYLSLRHALGIFFSSKWKLVVFILLLGGLLAYVLLDFAGKKGARDYSSGLAPRGVVELYYTAMNRLDLDVVQSLFYRRAGREAVNELSTLYVMSRLGQVYGGRYRAAEGGETPSILSVEVLEIEQLSDGDRPVFHARYKKMINTGDKKTEYLIDETLSIGKIKDRWYIVDAERRIVE
jgi:hypothetical protein